MAEKPGREEIKRRQATFRMSDLLILPRKPCPRCTPLGQSEGRGQIYIFVDKIWVKCSKCDGKGYVIVGIDP